MNFHDLIIDNFLAITHAKINLSDRGLVLIEGINNADTSAKSNGAGKSSIADALCWVWFGTTARGESGDDVINDKAGKSCSVSSVVIDGGLTYVATRHRKHKTGKNSLTLTVSDGFKTTDLTKGTDKLTQEVASQIIGSSLDVFAGSIYAGQEKMPDLPAMTDKSLKILIEEAAGVTALEGAYKKAREDALLAQGNLGSAQNVIAQTNVKRTAALGLCENLADAEKAWETSKVDRINVMKNAVITVSKPALVALQADIDALTAQDLPAQIAKIDAKIAGVSDEQKTLALLTSNAANRLAEYRGQIIEFGKAEALVDQTQTKLEEIEHRVGCPCDSCGRPLTENEIADAKRNATAARIKAVNNFKDQQAKVERDTTLHQKAVEELDAFRATLTDLTAENASRDALTRSLSILDAKKARAEALLKQIQTDIQTMRNIQAETSPYQTQIKSAQDALTKLDAALVADKAKIERLQHESDLMAEVVKVFSPAGVRARVLDEVTPYLNAQTSKYLSILSDGNIEAIWTTLTQNAKGEFKEKFSIDVTNATGGKKFGLISGGEKRKVRVATALALQDLVSTRATKPIDIFIGDEIDDALDAAGLERLMIILEEKARERGSVFIISHNELRDYIRNVITIEKTPTGETVVTESVS